MGIGELFLLPVAGVTSTQGADPFGAALPLDSTSGAISAGLTAGSVDTISPSSSSPASASAFANAAAFSCAIFFIFSLKC